MFEKYLQNKKPVVKSTKSHNWMEGGKQMDIWSYFWIFKWYEKRIKYWNIFSVIFQNFIFWFTTSKGFVDLGCGNGLLVYLLTKEGIPNGVGLDIRKRKIWNFFREQGTDLRYKVIHTLILVNLWLNSLEIH